MSGESLPALERGDLPGPVDSLTFFWELEYWKHFGETEVDQGRVEAGEPAGAPSYEVVVASWSVWDPLAGEEDGAGAGQAGSEEENELRGAKPARVRIKRADPLLDPSRPGSRPSLERELAFFAWAEHQAELGPYLRFPLPLDNPDRDQVCSRFPVDPAARPIFSGRSTHYSAPPRRDRADGGVGQGERERLLASLGRALGTLHRCGHAERLGDPRGRALRARLDHGPPPALALDRPGPAVLSDLSPARGELLRLLQDPARPFTSAFADARKAWAAGEGGPCLVHGDLEARSVLFSPGDREVRVEGFEGVRLGDPTWDLGAVLGQLARARVAAYARARQKKAKLARARTPARADPAVEAFLTAWVASAHPAGTASAAPTLRSLLRATALRLVHRVWGEVRNLGSLSELGTGGEGGLVLQLAENLLRGHASALPWIGLASPGSEPASTPAGEGRP